MDDIQVDPDANDGRVAKTGLQPRPFGRWIAALAGLGVVLGTVVAVILVTAQPPPVDDPMRQVRADAQQAVAALDQGDLPALAKQLTAHRGNPDFAYYLASQTTPRMLGDALASVSRSAGEPLLADVDRQWYELTLTDLAGTLGLATFGTGERALPAEWTDAFITATTQPEALTVGGVGNGPVAPSRVAQDHANSQNLLLLLARGYWAAPFLEAVTEAYWRHDDARGNEAWPLPQVEGAKYAPAPNGHYLTDGIVALSAALTANPEASAWAFTEFQPGTTEVEGSELSLGRFTHFLMFEHRFPESSAGESVGTTAVLTALSAAIDETNGAIGEADVDEGVTSAPEGSPLSDSRVLQSLAKDAKEEDNCSWNPLDYMDCAEIAIQAVLHWVEDWGRLSLDILSLGTFAPPPFNAVGAAAAVTNATWHVIDGDFKAAGLALATAVPGLVFVKIAQAAKAGRTAEKVAAEADEAAQATSKYQQTVREVNLARARESAHSVTKSPRSFPYEKDAQRYWLTKHPEAVLEKSIQCPLKAIFCGYRRLIDVYDPNTKMAYELKIGTRNQAQAIAEVGKDLELLKDRGTGVSKVEWHFFPDANGLVGPGEKLREALERAGIRYILHLP